MNNMEQLSHWLAAERESIDSKAHEWLERAILGDVSTEEAFCNISELIVQFRTLASVMKQLVILEEEDEEDGSDDFSWEDDEEIPLPFPDEV